MDDRGGVDVEVGRRLVEVEDARAVQQPAGQTFTVPGWSGQDNRLGLNPGGGFPTISNADTTQLITDNQLFRAGLITKKFTANRFEGYFTSVSATGTCPVTSRVPAEPTQLAARCVVPFAVTTYSW